MNARDLPKIRAGNAAEIQVRLTEAKLPKKIPSKPGVYVIHTHKPFSRVRERSDIILIGQTNDKRGIRYRLGRLLSGSAGGHVAKHRIRMIAEAGFRLSVMWRVSARNKQIEAQFLTLYEREHLELPPANHALPNERSPRHRRRK